MFIWMSLCLVYDQFPEHYTGLLGFIRDSRDFIRALASIYHPIIFQIDLVS